MTQYHTINATVNKTSTYKKNNDRQRSDLNSTVAITEHTMLINKRQFNSKDFKKYNCY